MCTVTICQCRVITINNEGNNSTSCCRSGLCLCSNFSDALEHLESHTILNITSQFVTLDNHVTMSSRNINSVLMKSNNITILGNGATVMCNKKVV